MRAGKSGLLLLIGVVSVACGESDAPTEPEAPSSVGLALVAEGLTAPVALVEPPGGAGRRMIVDQTGVIRVLAGDANLLAEPFLDVRGKLVPLRPGYDERGLLGLAFHPGYATNGRFFVYYSTPRRSDTPAGFDHINRLSEFRVSADRNRADAASERILLEMPHPQSNHNGGTIAFGPDGNLYLSVGEGGVANDPGVGHVGEWFEANRGGSGQASEQYLRGGILRFEVNGGSPERGPADDPVVGRAGLDES
ncbi:MAG: PQQ-dependent sugar dehydrogenase, partial [Gemmatimonadetes bacterium]|nr:PQQ-dependent sugar dehydrogenase [Gemmatimonadota bacterium]